MIVWQEKSLGQVCSFISGGTPSTKIKRYFMGNIPWITSADINGNTVSKARHYITHEAIKSSATNLVPRGNILLVTRTGVGKVAINEVDICISQDFTAILPAENKVDIWFLFYFLKLRKEHFVSKQRGATIQGITRNVVSDLCVPLPPLAEQKRIADILNAADRLRRLRRYALELSEGFLQSVFLEMFGDLDANHHQWKVTNLGSISDIPTGVTKGRNFAGKKTVNIPYLRVANVQDGYLDLSIIKDIEALPADVDRLRLEPGDVLMTEGGDFDKLGRGAVWEGQVDPCIHQNHVFRVRLDNSQVLPKYFAQVLLTPYTKGYFLKASKQTTNLATINKTQLRAFPLPIPPLEMQTEFIDQVRQHERLQAQQREAIRQADHLFETLLHRAFRGEI